MILDNKQLKDFLIDTGLITKSDYFEAEDLAQKSKHKETPESILVSQGKISEDDLRKAHAHVFGIAFVDLRNKKIARALIACLN